MRWYVAQSNTARGGWEGDVAGDVSLDAHDGCGPEVANGKTWRARLLLDIKALMDRHAG